MLPFAAERSARMCGGEDRRDLLHRVTTTSIPCCPLGSCAGGVGRAGGGKRDPHRGRTQHTLPTLPPLPLSCLHPWAEEEEGGRGGRDKQEQVGTRDGVFAQEPCVSHFLSLPELIG